MNRTDSPPSPPSPLARDADMTLADQLAEHFAARIGSRLMPPGTRLPSVRECARRHAVSAYTVVAAYDRLQARGLVEARRNRGFFVREQRPPLPPPAPARPGPAPVDATALIRGLLQTTDARGRPTGPTPGMGVLPPDWLDVPFLGSALRRLTAAPQLRALSLEYGDPAGDAQLRQALSRHLATLDIAAPPAQILTTIGASHALDIVSRTLLRPGDHVMVEEPGWAVEFARLSQMGLHILPVPRHADGPDLEVMTRYCEQHAPRLFVCVSVLHNPTSTSIGPACAHRLLQLAQAHDFHIVEDDSYAWLAPGHATRLSALDGLRRTLYVSGFAKTLAPNWRVGFLAGSPALVQRLTDLKMLTTLTTPALFEQALAHCLEQGQIRRHAARLRSRLDAARSRSVALARQAGCCFVHEPAGLFGWVDVGQDTDRLAQRLLDHGHLLAPGSLFHAGRHPTTLMRINYAGAQDAGFWTLFDRCRALP